MNRESYDRIASQWAAHRTRLSGAESRLLTMLTDGLAGGATVLDLGCGTGAPIATHLADAGYRIVGVDQSAAMLQYARERLPTHTWIESRIEEFPPVAAVSAAIAWDSLFHIPRAQHASIFRRVRENLPVAGRFALTAGGSASAPFTDTMFDEPFFYDSHAPGQTRVLLEAAGFQILHEELLNVPDGARDKGRAAFIAIAQ